MQGVGNLRTNRSSRIIRIAGLIAPVILVAYGILIESGYIPSDNFVSNQIFLVIALVWLTTAIGAFFSSHKSTAASRIVLGLYYALGSAYVLFVSGLNTPFIILWVLLLLSSRLAIGSIGVKAGVLVFALIVAVDSFIIHSGDAQILLANISIMVAIFLSALAILAIHKTQQVDQTELSHVKKQGVIERERILTIVNNLADAILSTDANGIIRVYNAASLNLLDTNDSLNGRHIDGVLKLTDDSGQAISLHEDLQSVKTVKIRDDLRFDTGVDEILRIEATLSPIRSSYSGASVATGDDGYIIILRDITKSKSLEEERDEFISVVSHELRTPITIAEGSISNAQLVLERGESKPEVLQSALDTAHEQVLFLARMVNDLSTLSRAERGVADEGEEIELKSLAEGLFNEYLPQATEKNLHFNLDIGTHLGSVYASRLYLRELIQNFITNSIKYTTEGSITLSIHKKDGQAIFTVKDTGIGISKADQVKIFDKFYRAEDYRTRETSGTGLGLYVAAKLSRKLGCKIELSSRLNHGSSFSFSLPILKK